MRTDTIFYQLFQLMPNLLSELLGKVGDDYSVLRNYVTQYPQ
jgi:predicted transposase YdaD